MSMFGRKEADPVVQTPDVREALRRADPEFARNVSVMAADRFGARHTLEQKKTAHGNLTDALNAAILRVYELAELHRDSTEDLLEAAKRGRADVEAKLEFINEIERSLKGGSDASNTGNSPAADGNGSTGGGQASAETAVQGLPITGPGR